MLLILAIVFAALAFASGLIGIVGLFSPLGCSQSFREYPDYYSRS